MVSERTCEDGCLCDKYACTMRRKNLTIKADTGVKNGASYGLPKNVKQTSLGQDGAAGRAHGGKMI